MSELITETFCKLEDLQPIDPERWKPYKTWRPKAFLPNADGFEFIALLRNRTEVLCHVAKNLDGLHGVVGAQYEDIAAWRPKT